MPIASRRFRNALGRFATGVTVVTAIAGDGRPVGVTVNAFASLSLEPPLVLVSLARTTADLDAYLEGERFAVNILSDRQQALSAAFSRRPKTIFRRVAYDTWESGCPILAGCLANLECTRIAVHEGGDHFIIVGRVDRLDHTDDGNPLIYFRGGYARIRDAARRSGRKSGLGD